MTDVLTRAEKAINKLTELTQDGNLKWSIIAPSEYFPKDDIDGPVFKTRYGTNDLILYRKAYFSSNALTVSALSATRPFSAYLTSPVTEDKVTKNYAAELSVCKPSSYLVIYTFPYYSSSIRELYNAAAYRAADIDNLLDSLLGNDNGGNPE